MNKSELIDSVAKKTGLTNKEAHAAVNGFIETVKESLAKNDSVVLIGFGTFLVRERAARKGRNPSTGEPLDIPAVKVPAFRAGSVLKEAVKGK